MFNGHTCLALGLAIASLAAVPRSPAQTYRVLPLGDSITMGVDGYQTYRYRLWIKLVNAGIAMDYVGTRTDNYEGTASYPNYLGRVFDRAHEGHAGWRAQDLLDGCTAGDPCITKNQGYLGQWLNAYTPDIVLLHIGSNDIFQSAPQSTTVASINNIITSLRGDNPNAIILLAQITPLPGVDRDIKIRALNAQIAAIAAARTTAQSPVHLVDQYTGFSSLTDTFDGTHPNTSGEEKMAQKWYVAIEEALNRNNPPQVDAGVDRWASQFRVGVNLAGGATDDGNPISPGALTYAWTQLAGPPATIAQPNAPITPAGFTDAGDYQFRLTAWDGEFAADDTMVVHLQPFSCPRLHFESGGRVVFEAEKTRSRTPGIDAFGFTYWDTATDQPGFTGSSAMAARPTATSYANANDELIGCHMDYWVEFVTPGTYYAWVRMLGPAGNANSIHLGVDGAPVTLGLRGMEEDSGTWQWIGTANDQRVAIPIAQPGRHRIDVWMREDGIYVDKLLLDLDNAFTPSGLGPALSDSGQVCDFDEDGMDDTWELDHWNGLAVNGSDNSDADTYLNVEEYIAGTDPEDTLSYPVVTAVQGPGGEGLSFLSATGRYYQLEYSDPRAGLDAWLPIGPEVAGTGELLTLSDPSPAPARTYRFRVRADGP